MYIKLHFKAIKKVFFLKCRNSEALKWCKVNSASKNVLQSCPVESLNLSYLNSFPMFIYTQYITCIHL